MWDDLLQMGAMLVIALIPIVWISRALMNSMLAGDFSVEEERDPGGPGIAVTWEEMEDFMEGE